jgi:hypothetical protein
MPCRRTAQPLIRPPSTWTTPAVKRERPAAKQQAPSQTPISESTTPRTRVERELRALGNHNTAGQTELEAPTNRTRHSPQHFGYFAAVDDVPLPDDFEILMLDFSSPIWNDNTQTFESASETQDPFSDGFRLTPEHESWKPFKNQQLTHPLHKESGYYRIPGAYLGYKPNKTPEIYLHRIDIPNELMFNKASMSDPDTLTWDQAMSEPQDNIEKWLEAADIEIKALEGKETWEEVPLSSATVKVIPGT